ncbi:MAG: RNA polymerase sigma factor [Chlorobi bacterium]|nr:RNA polymerase sigma factor [Chlorobiota bacterium]
MNLTEEELIRLCKNNNAKAQKLLFNKYYGLLLGICVRYGKSKAEAEDILQTGMLRIFKHIGSYSGKGSFEGWMKRIVVNVAIDNFRKNNKHYYYYDIDELNGEPYLVSDIPDNLEVKDILKTIHQLPHGYRMVFNLFAIEGYSHKEIALRMGISENTSKTQLLKARKSLRKKLMRLNKLPQHKKVEI